MSTLNVPASMRPLIARIAAHARGAGIEAHVVGGTVRDLLLGRETRDLDLAVDRDALAWARRLADDLHGHFVALDDVNAVARVVLDGAAVSYVDVAALQGTLDRDMRRRDFTVDAIAARIDTFELVDVCGGLADIEARLVRMNGAYVFDEDPLRLLRGVRIASELEFALEAATQAAIRERAARVLESAAERRRDELARMFALSNTYDALRLLDDLGLLDAMLPEVAAGKGVTQPKEHTYDVFEHQMRTVEALDLMLAPARPAGERAWLWDVLWRVFAWCEASLRAYLAEEMSEGRSRSAILKVAGLLHDAGKPLTRKPDVTGRIRFFGHADAGAEIAARVMRGLRFSGREVAFVTLLVDQHLRPVQLARAGEVPTRRALYRFYRALGDAAPAVLLLSLADAAAARGPRMTAAGWSRHAGYMNSLLVRSLEEEGIVNPPRLLTGRDIMDKLGIPEGPDVGRLLEAVREAQAAGEVKDVEGALALVERLGRRP
jgi:putative nucleotidyltransferase with HDIG domain